MNNKEKTWINKAIDQEKTILEVKRKLEDGNYPQKKIDELLDYYRNRVKELSSEIEPLENQEDFKEDVKKFVEDANSLGFWKRREVKKFLKQVEVYNQVLQKSVGKIKEEMLYIHKEFGNTARADKELELVKEQLITLILDSQEILDIEDPKTGDVATQENLSKNSLNELMNLMVSIIKLTRDVVNGKIE